MTERSDLRDKSEVVANKHHSSVKVINCLSQRVYSLHVEVICRLVK